MAVLNEIKVDVDVSSLDEALEKAKKLKDLLLEVTSLIESLK